MATYPPMKTSLQETKYTIRSENQSYVLTVRQSQDSIFLYIGGHHTYCLECQLFTQDSSMKRYFDTSIGDLSHVYYNEACAINSKFKRGDDTNRILKLIISYVSQNYSYIRGLSFMDERYRDCDTGGTVDLANMYYCLHGKTWYMSKLDATFLHEKDKLAFEKAHADFTTLKTTLPWNIVNEYITTRLPMDESKLQTLYETTSTWQEFFSAIEKEIGISEFCGFIAPWIKGFLNRFFKFDMGRVKFITFLDSPKHKPLLQYDLLPYSQKGGKYTRKAPKRRARDLR